jgi:hypothetical protein
MSTPSRESIRSRLRQGAQQKDGVVTRGARRFAPVGRDESGPRPTHRAYIKADMSMCCAYHEECSFHVTRRWIY